jgi:AbiV family abortive infection protein
MRCLNRTRLQALADRYVADAKILLQNGSWSSAYYLVGYAIECALKACIARQVQQHDFPDLQTVKRSYTHDLKELLKLAGLQGELEVRAGQSVEFRDNWHKVVIEWNESSRYENPTQAMAEEMVRAVSDDGEGVIKWLTQHW